MKDQMVTLVYRSQMKQLTIHKQKGEKKRKYNHHYMMAQLQSHF